MNAERNLKWYNLCSFVNCLTICFSTIYHATSLIGIRMLLLLLMLFFLLVFICSDFSIQVNRSSTWENRKLTLTMTSIAKHVKVLFASLYSKNQMKCWIIISKTKTKSSVYTIFKSWLNIWFILRIKFHPNERW